MNMVNLKKCIFRIEPLVVKLDAIVMLKTVQITMENNGEMVNV